MTETEELPEIQPARTKKLSDVAGVRFKSELEKARFYKVYNQHKERAAKSGKALNVSDIIWKMFVYLETNPYGEIT